MFFYFFKNNYSFKKTNLSCKFNNFANLKFSRRVFNNFIWVLHMDKYRKESARRFGICLRDSLRKKYPLVKITAVFLASQYNLRSTTSNTISNESARKWLNGISLPSVHRFEVLREWLGIDNSFIAKYDELNNFLIVNSSFDGIQTNDLSSILSKSNLFDRQQIDFIQRIVTLLDNGKNNINN